MPAELLKHLSRVHTTALGMQRVRKNLDLDAEDVVQWCKQQIENAKAISRAGKNWYVHGDGFVITVNAHSYTVITAHKKDNG